MWSAPLFFASHFLLWPNLNQTIQQLTLFKAVLSKEPIVMQKVFDAILNLHHYKDQAQMVKFISQDIGMSEDKVLSLLNQFKSKYLAGANSSIFN